MRWITLWPVVNDRTDRCLTDTSVHAFHPIPSPVVLVCATSMLRSVQKYKQKKTINTDFNLLFKFGRR